MSDLPKLFSENLFRHVGGARSGRIVSSLCDAYPHGIRAKALMIKAGLPFHDCELTAFVELCNAFLKINSILPRHGWQVTRTDGTPRAEYRLESIAGQ